MQCANAVALTTKGVNKALVGLDPPGSRLVRKVCTLNKRRLGLRPNQDQDQDQDLPTATRPTARCKQAQPTPLDLA
jgi:hypothetical protein